MTFPVCSPKFSRFAPKNSRFDFTGNSALNRRERGLFFAAKLIDHALNLRNSRFFSLIDGNLTAETGSIRTASTTTQSDANRYLPGSDE
jgi:hypothetical protein